GIFRVLCRETLVQRLTGSSCQIRVVTGESRARVEAEDVDTRQESVACETCTDVLVGEILLRDPQFRPFLESSRQHRVQFRHVSLVWLGQLVDCVDSSGIQLRINSLAQQLFELSFLKLKVGLRNNQVALGCCNSGSGRCQFDCSYRPYLQFALCVVVQTLSNFQCLLRREDGFVRRREIPVRILHLNDCSCNLRPQEFVCRPHVVRSYHDESLIWQNPASAQQRLIDAYGETAIDGRV